MRRPYRSAPLLRYFVARFVSMTWRWPTVTLSGSEESGEAGLHCPLPQRSPPRTLRRKAPQHDMELAHCHPER